MGMARNTALLTTAAEVVDLTGQQDLGNLETDGEFSVSDLLLSAHKWVFDRLDGRLGVDPTLLTNEVRLERAVALKFLELLVANGYLAEGDPERRDYFGAQAVDEVDNFRPALSSGDEARVAGEAIPVVLNLRRRGFFDQSGGTSGTVYKGIPRVL